MKLIFTQGLPASGKSTWSKKFCQENPGDWVRVNRDDFRNMRGKYWVPKQEGLITKWENACVGIALSSGFNVILDATNMNDERNKSRANHYLLHDEDLVWETKRFDVSVDECIKRDLKRANSVGEKVIRKMNDKYNPTPRVIDNQDTDLTPCILVDIDGTIAQMVEGGRSPYDWDRVGEDEPRFSEINFVQTVYGYTGPVGAKTTECSHVIIFSGRDGSCREETEAWLRDHNVPYDQLHMREAGDQRKDSIIKRELFDAHIKDKFWCWLVLDDRNQVVDMWRDMGLTCWQVQPGDF